MVSNEASSFELSYISIRNTIHLPMFLDQPSTVPVWFANHVGLWNPEFRSLLAELSWENIYEDLDLATRLVIDSANELALDAITPLTHPLAAAALLGSKLRFGTDGLPALNDHLHSPAQIRSLHLRSSDVLDYDLSLIKACQERSDKKSVVVRHLGPFSLTGHLIEGLSPWQPRFRALMFQYPAEARTLLARSTEAIIAWAKALKNTGVEYLYIEEPLADLIGPEDQMVFIAPWLEQIIKEVPEIRWILKVPGMDSEITRFKKAGVWAWFPDLHTPAGLLREQSHWSLPIVGPFDVGRLLSPVPVIHQSAGRFIELYGARDFIVSLSSVPLPHTDTRSLRAFVDAVKSFDVKA